MTATKVVDASALAALLFGEPEAEAVVARLDGARLVAPGLLAIELALETGLTAYGASYLSLARRLGAELVTLDQPLDAAARAG